MAGVQGEEKSPMVQLRTLDYMGIEFANQKKNGVSNLAAV